MHARCNVPPLSRVGNLNVSVSSDNGVTFRYQGNFLVGTYRLVDHYPKRKARVIYLQPIINMLTSNLLFLKVGDISSFHSRTQ